MKGISFCRNWNWKVTDGALLPCDHMMVNEVVINGVVRAMKHEANVPGIRVYSVQATVKCGR